MTGHPRGPFVVPDHPVACPFCGNALMEGRFHSCRELREDRQLAPLEVDLDRVAGVLLVILIIVVASYLGAHFLSSLGVCPGLSAP